jgi:MFS family permease
MVEHILKPGTRFDSDVPPRLDRLPWSPWHWRVVIALGVTWVLDGLEVTLAGAVGTALKRPEALGLTDSQIGISASAYLFGAITGALVFGRLTDRYGRKKLFLVTLALYLGATLASGLSLDFVMFVVCRALTGAGIGGEYAAINSAIDELLPARLRGRADLIINSTYWLGAAVGAASTLVLLNENVLPAWLGWRLTFVLGATLGLSILFIRRHLPESPRWLLLHGRAEEAERVVNAIEKDVAEETKSALPPPASPATIVAKGKVTFTEIARVLLKKHRKRTVLGLSLMIAQAFAYNAVFFTYALVLGRFYDVAPGRIGLYLIPFAIGNLLGPVVLGHAFDTVGRRTMISATYGAAGILLALSGLAFERGWLSAMTQTLLWCSVFFVASAAASSAYLTVSELFPVELRGMAIALFFAVGTGVGGLTGPALFGALVESGSRARVSLGYFVGAALMLLAACVALLLGVAAERRSLEQINEL